jgi:F-type H+-transporting ATPase subunit delta
LKLFFSEKFDELTLAFINIILRKGRESYLPEIATEFVEQYKELKDITTVKVTSATPLTAAALERIKTRLANSEATRANIELETAIDKNLIGGFKFEFGDKLYDASVKHQLELLRKELTSNEYLKN